VFAERLIVLKRSVFFGTKYVCCLHYTFLHIPPVNGSDFFAIICEIAKLA
jgi:hypothetical protein